MSKRGSGLLAEIEDDLLSDRPLASALRKCVLLGGKVGSADLREWATRELKGYGDDDEVPEFRTVPATIRADAITGNSWVKGQRISPSMLPDFAQDDIKEEVTFRGGIATIESMAQKADDEDNGLKLSLPMAADLASLMDAASGNPFQHISELYWSVSRVALQNIIDQTRTTLIELVAEMTAGSPADGSPPSGEVADQAVHVAVYGDRSRVTVTSANSFGDGATSTAGAVAPESPFWTRSRRIGAFVAGAASIIGLGFALAQWQNWI